MDDTEPMPAVAAPNERTEPSQAAAPPLGRVAAMRPPWTALAVALSLAVAFCALLACAYLHGEVVALRGELGATRIAAHAAERAADRASLDAENARTALANAVPPEPTDPPANTDDGN